MDSKGGLQKAETHETHQAPAGGEKLRRKSVCNAVVRQAKAGVLDPSRRRFTRDEVEWMEAGVAEGRPG
jgi:hypothetical protein